MNLIFDLDGTLIDSKLRLYELFQNLVPESSLRFGDYWELKRNKISNEMILKNLYSYNDEMMRTFSNSWMAFIESPHYLGLDKIYSGIDIFIEIIAQQYDLYVCTDRQFTDRTLNQLHSLKLLNYFKKILVTEQKKSKPELIAANVIGLNSSDWMIGDTGRDIQAGKDLGIKTCAVTSGFMSLQSLKSYQPHLIIDKVVNFIL